MENLLIEFIKAAPSQVGIIVVVIIFVKSQAKADARRYREQQDSLVKLSQLANALEASAHTLHNAIRMFHDMAEDLKALKDLPKQL